MFIKANIDKVSPKNWMQFLALLTIVLIIVVLNTLVLSGVLYVAWNYVIVPTIGGVHPIEFTTSIIAAIAVYALKSFLK